MVVKIAFMLILAFFMVLLYDQLPEYILGAYSDYLILVLIAIFGALAFVVGKMK